jgi:RNA polymerase sigma factor (sigma-70 family)
MWETDEQLVRGMRQQSKKAFQLFYERYVDYVYQIVIAIVRDHDQALDLCQELFLEYFLKAHTYNPERGSVRAWIAVRARSRSIDYLRKNKRYRSYEVLDQVHVQTTVTPHDLYVEREERERVIENLLKLPAQQRSAIVDNYFHQLSHSQIATKTNKPLGSVKSMIRYGLQNLRKLYEQDPKR